MPMEIYNPVNPGPLPLSTDAIQPDPRAEEPLETLGNDDSSQTPDEPATDPTMGQAVDLEA
ncbi:MAG: hypothetical protein Kow009_04680 [Spirochaetales bacterium]